MIQTIELVDRFQNSEQRLAQIRAMIQSRYNAGVSQAKELKGENPEYERTMVGPIQGYIDELNNCRSIILSCNAKDINSVELAFYHASHDEGFLSVFNKV